MEEMGRFAVWSREVCGRKDSKEWGLQLGAEEQGAREYGEELSVHGEREAFEPKQRALLFGLHATQSRHIQEMRRRQLSGQLQSDEGGRH